MAVPSGYRLLTSEDAGKIPSQAFEGCFIDTSVTVVDLYPGVVYLSSPEIKGGKHGPIIELSVLGICICDDNLGWNTANISSAQSAFLAANTAISGFTAFPDWNNWLYVKDKVSEYTVTATVTNGTFTGDQAITDTATVTISANSGYALPVTVTVTGASYTYASGVISLFCASGNVTINARCTALLTTLVKNTADAIRGKKGTSALIDPQSFPDEIGSLYTVKDLLSNKATGAYSFYLFQGETLDGIIGYDELSRFTELTGAFNSCTNLESIRINTDKVTACNNLFNGCRRVKTIDITKLPSSNTSTNLFKDCRSVEKIIIRGVTAVPPIDAASFTNCYHLDGTLDADYNPTGASDCLIYVPDELVNAFKSATNWSTYAQMIRGLSELVEE